MKALKCIAAGMLMMSMAAGCSNVDLDKEIDLLLANEFAAQVQEYKDIDRDFKESSDRVGELLSKASADNVSTSEYQVIMMTVDSVQSRMQSLTSASYNKKLDIIAGVLKALKSKGLISNMMSKKNMEKVGDRLLKVMDKAAPEPAQGK